MTVNLFIWAFWNVCLLLLLLLLFFCYYCISWISWTFGWKPFYFILNSCAIIMLANVTQYILYCSWQIACRAFYATTAWGLLQPPGNLRTQMSASQPPASVAIKSRRSRRCLDMRWLQLRFDCKSSNSQQIVKRSYIHPHETQEAFLFVLVIIRTAVTLKGQWRHREVMRLCHINVAKATPLCCVKCVALEVESQL